MITIVDYGMGNLNSVANMIKKVGGKTLITSDIEDIKEAEKLILPGVGAFDSGMKNIRHRGLEDILNLKAKKDKIPVLGICLGMQLITESSDEGEEPGLGWIEAKTKKFRFNDLHLKVPHMGWNHVVKTSPTPLLEGIDKKSRFYFVHSYYVECTHPETPILNTFYGIKFCSGVQADNIYGLQFHPEKSHRHGMTVLKNFCFNI